MKLPIQFAFSRPLPFCLVAIALCFAGCKREEVKTYRIATEEAAPQSANFNHPMPDGHPHVERAKPKVSWTLPPGWKEVDPSSEMTIAAFDITEGDQEAQVAITPLRGMAGKEVAIVNMWRQVVGLPQISAEEVEKQLQPVAVGAETGKMYEINNQPDGANRPTRVVAAMVHRPEASWFYKLAGDTDFVEKQKPAFVAFLKSIKIEEPSSAASAEVTTTKSDYSETTQSSDSNWKIPAGWKEATPGQMQIAKFSVPEKNGAKADVAVSVFPNATGGALANVNRWRGQIGLPPISEADLSKVVMRIDEKNPDTIVVDISNENRQLIGAIVPRDGQWYFFKLMGDAAAVAPQKDAFVSFVKSPK